MTDVLHVGVVFDRSGSMGAVWHGAISGINDYIKQLQDDEDADTTFVTLAAFDDRFEIVHDHCPIGEIPAYDGTEFPPRGSTALNDSIADMISHLDGKIGDEKALVVVLTDGYENASKRYPSNKEGKSPKLVGLVKEYENKGNWTFVYLGANDPDVYETAAGIGIAAGNAAFYSSTPSGYRSASTTLANVTRARKSSISGQSASTFDDAGEDQDIRDEADRTPVEPPKLGRKGKIDSGSLTDRL